MGLLGSIAGFALGGLGPGGAVLGAKSQRKAAKKAAAFSQQTADTNNALATGQYAPYTAGGHAATGAVNSLLGLSANPTAANAAFDNYRNSTGYQFRLGEGMNALNSGYAAGGVLQSGAAMRGAQEYGQNFASNEFDNYLRQLNGQQQLGLGASNALVGTTSTNNWMNSDNQGNAALIRGQNNPFAAFAGSVTGLAQGALSGGLRF